MNPQNRNCKGQDGLQAIPSCLALGGPREAGEEEKKFETASLSQDENA
jgi:hypothetical protein